MQAMDAFSIAAEMLGDLRLTSGQLGQLRALDYRLLIEIDRLSGLRRLEDATSETSSAFEPTPNETAALREMIVGDILEMLTPEQRTMLGDR
jgi:hypothetical protein